jgi:hypothetical protein
MGHELAIIQEPEHTVNFMHINSQKVANARMEVLTSGVQRFILSKTLLQDLLEVPYMRVVIVVFHGLWISRFLNIKNFCPPLTCLLLPLATVTAQCLPVYVEHSRGLVRHVLDVDVRFVRLFRVLLHVHLHHFLDHAGSA